MSSYKVKVGSSSRVLAPGFCVKSLLRSAYLCLGYQILQIYHRPKSHYRYRIWDKS